MPEQAEQHEPDAFEIPETAVVAPDTAIQTPDAAPDAVGEAPPSDVMEIVASLDAESDGGAESESDGGAESESDGGAESESDGGAESDADIAERAPAPAGPSTRIENEVDLPPQAMRARAPLWPFLVYVGIWLAGGVAAGWLLWQTAPGVPVLGTQTYRIVVFAALGLSALGPILAIVVWLAVVLRHRGESHAGVFTGSLLKGALATLCGVAIWWGMLLIVDTLRLGRPL